MTDTETEVDAKKARLMPWTAHLRELRNRLMVVGAVVVVGLVVCFIFYPQILQFLQKPYCSAQALRGNKCDFYVTGVLDPLSLRIKVSLYGGLFLALPVAMFELWRFIAPGLKHNEKRYAAAFVAATTVFFAMGVALAFYSFPHALGFLLKIGGSDLQDIISPISYLSFIIVMMALFGAAFEFPVLLVAIQMVGIVTPGKLLGFWRFAVIGIFVIAATFTPSGDPFSMLVMAVPLTVFYFLAIGVGKLLGK